MKEETLNRISIGISFFFLGLFFMMLIDLYIQGKQNNKIKQSDNIIEFKDIPEGKLILKKDSIPMYDMFRGIIYYTEYDDDSLSVNHVYTIQKFKATDGKMYHIKIK